MKSVIAAMAIAALSIQPALAQGREPASESKAPLYGTLIGLAAGVTAGGLFSGLTNCHYGSDSAGAMIACGAITGGLIAGGAILGHTIGHRVAKARPADPGRAGFTAAEWAGESAKLAQTVKLSAPEPRPDQAQRFFPTLFQGER